MSYAKQAIDGVLLLSVIGGKTLEGINLSDEMARNVVVLGLTNADIKHPGLQE